jgi:hypothetical protein
MHFAQKQATQMASLQAYYSTAKKTRLVDWEWGMEERRAKM